MPITTVLLHVADLTRSTAFGTTPAGAWPPRAELRATTYGSTVLADPDGLVLALTGDLA